MAHRSVFDFFQVPQWIKQSICLDLGSSMTRVMVEKRLVYQQPTCFTWHHTSQSIISLGQTALLSYDKTPSSVELVFPVKHGQISHPARAQAYLKAVLAQALKVEKRLPIVLGIAGTVAIPAATTPVEKHILKETLSQVGVTRVALMTKAEAIQAFLAKSEKSSQHLCLIDIGAQTVEIGLFTQGNCLMSTTVLIGGDTYTQEVVSLLKDEYQAETGWMSAERLKHQFKVNVTTGKGTDHKMTVRAKQTALGIPTTVSVSSGLLQERFHLINQSIVSELQLFLAQAPAELLTSALEQGLYITGGGSLLSGLVEDISQQLKTHFSLSKYPQEDVIRGLIYGSEN